MHSASNKCEVCMSELDPSFTSQARQFTGAEVPLNPSEIIVSRSDGRGVVLSGNAVFQRMTGRSWDELLGAPHKVIRHPDMPKAVFHLMWARLQAGLPIGAYVKNRDKAGGYYWVFAVIAPTQDGYISVRIKPMGPMRSKVEAQTRARAEANDMMAENAQDTNIFTMPEGDDTPVGGVDTLDMS